MGARQPRGARPVRGRQLLCTHAECDRFRSARCGLEPPLAGDSSDAWQVVLLPTISIGDANVTEGDSGTASASFAITLSAAAVETVTVKSLDRRRHGDRGRRSINPREAATVTFNRRAIEQGRRHPRERRCDADEADERFFVNLSNPSNGTIADGQGLGTIVNDDPLPKLSIDSVSHSEGDSGTTTYTFTVSLSAASGRRRDGGLGRRGRNRAPRRTGTTRTRAARSPSRPGSLRRP